MSTIRETLETTYVAAAFAERNLSEEARTVLHSEHQQKSTRPATSKRVAQPRPTLQAK
ncbi:hypothetical protein MASR1M90_05460 [Desulfovibrionales bacterium]